MITPEQADRLQALVQLAPESAAHAEKARILGSLHDVDYSQKEHHTRRQILLREIRGLTEPTKETRDENR